MIGLLLLPLFASAAFHADFYDFLVEKYGVTVADSMNRASNPSYAFGGGPSTSGKRPVIFNHGISRNAGEYGSVIAAFKDKGYTDADLFGTTYGSGVGNVANYLRFPIKCEYPELIRRLIDSVAEYRNTTVDVIGYSLGSAVARKAILGGKCAENKKELGAPLTDKVNVYLSVAGANRGSGLCPVPTIITPVCNGVNGLYCKSRYFKDLNAPVTRYEGAHSYSIFSKADEVVLNINSCLTKPGTFNNATMIWVQKYKHSETIYKTVEQQLQILEDHA